MSMNTLSMTSHQARPVALTPHIRVQLGHSCPIMRAGLATILRTQADLTVVTDERCSWLPGEEYVLITDYAGGLAATRQGCQEHAGQAPHAARVLVLTNRDKEWEVRLAIDHGVRGYLLHGCAPDELVHCVRLLGSGNSYLCPGAVRSANDAFAHAMLTRREHDVLRVLARGGADKQIARELGIGAGTVKTHLKHLLLKLEATTRTHAVVIAIERGLLAGAPDAAHAPTPADTLAVALNAAPRLARLRAA